MNKILHLSKSFFIETVRNKAEIFYILVLPLVFLFLFGFMFGSGANENGTQKFTYGVVIEKTTENASEVQKSIEKGFKDHKIKVYANTDILKQEIAKGIVDEGIVVKNNKHVVFMYTQNVSKSNAYWARQTASGIMNCIFYGITPEDTYINVKDVKVELGRTNSNQIDYLLTGVIAISILSGGMFPIISTYGRYKKLGAIKRFLVAPIKPVFFVISSSVSRVLFNLLSVVLIIIAGKFMFNVNYQMDWGMFFLTSFSGIVAMMGFGILLLIIFREAASSAASVLFTVMTFFAGIYFPITFIPDYLRWISYGLPVKYVVDLIRAAAGLEMMTPLTFWTMNLGFLAAGIILLIVASKIFVEENK